MLPNDEMVRALDAALEEPHGGRHDAEISRDALTASLDALDRDALVDEAADALASTGLEHALRERAEVVLRAVGLIA